MDSMDLGKHSLEDVFLSAIRAEMDSKEFYSKLAARVKNAVLKDRMNFLSNEEERHRSGLTTMFKTYFPGKEPKIPDKTPVPLPEVKFVDGSHPPLVEVLEQAMKAERAAQSFYLGMSEKLKDDGQVRDTLKYFAAMEGNHYKILEAEKANAMTFEDYDETFPLMHAGP